MQRLRNPLLSSRDRSAHAMACAVGLVRRHVRRPRKEKRTLRIPWSPMAETADEEAKYRARRAQMNWTLVICHLSPMESHSDSCSPLSVRHAARTWRVRMALVMEPKRVMRVEAVLLYRRGMVAGGEREKEEKGKTKRRKGRRNAYQAARRRAMSSMTKVGRPSAPLPSPPSSHALRLALTCSS